MCHVGPPRVPHQLASWQQQRLCQCQMLLASSHSASATKERIAKRATSGFILSTVVVPPAASRCCLCSVAELYSNLPAHAASQLSGVGGAAQLRAAGYTAGAVQEGAAAGAFSAWDLRAAGYHYTAAPPISCPPQDTTTSQQSPRNRPSHASAAAQQSFRQHRSHPNQTALLLQQQQEQIVKQGLGTAQQQQDLQYFRHQVVPLMQMKPEQHTPPLLLGTKVRLCTGQASVFC